MGSNTILADLWRECGLCGIERIGATDGDKHSAAATTTALVQPNPVPLNGSMPLTATVTSTTRERYGNRDVHAGLDNAWGRPAITDGTATLNVAVTAANGFAVGANTIGCHLWRKYELCRDRTDRRN